jgi:DNA-binding NarL/FixJ family response regulator
VDASVQRRLVELVAGPASTPPPTAADLGGLTRREVDVVRLVAEGLSNQQIARRLVVSEATVKTHLNHVLSKLSVDGRPGLVAWAWRQGLAAR